MEANRRNEILEGRTVLGVEFGSTRIKAVLIGEDNILLASGNHDWENALVKGIWTYALEDVGQGCETALLHLQVRYGNNTTQPLPRLAPLESLP